MYNEVIKLVSVKNTVDEYGDTVTTETETEVFAQLRSIGQSEFYQSRANGFRPEVKFIIADFLDYSGEQLVRYQPYGAEEEIDYRVIRTYQNGTELEITCQRGVVDSGNS